MALELSLRVAAPEDVYDTVIIGGGPAGLSAAIYAARAELKTLVVDMNPKAGALAITSKIANYPGVPEAVSGEELLFRFRRQAESFGAEIVQAQVLATSLRGEVKEVVTSEGVFKAQTVIIASGALGRKASLKGEAELLGKGVSYCAACDAAFFRDKDVAVIGSSEMMTDELGIVAKFARRIYLIPRGKLSDEQQSVVRTLPNVEVLPGARVEEILGVDEGRVTGVAVREDGEAKVLPVAGVFVYLRGNRPSTNFLDGSVETTEDGCIAVDPVESATSQPGVFAVGDVTCNPVRQAVVAAAQGTLAGLAVDKYLRKAKRMRQQWD